MSHPLECPDCGAMNKAGQVRCRSCGRKLVEVGASSRPSAPVTLQRVMSGEIFTAVVGDVPPEAMEEPEETPEQAPARVSVSPPEAEETSQILTALADRLAQRAEAEKQRFKTYHPVKARRADTEEAQKAVAKQLESAVGALKDHRFDAAVEHLLKALSKEDSDPRTWILLGGAYLRLDRPYKAAVGYLRALELDPKNGSAWLGLSRVFKAVGDLGGSLEVLDRTVQVNPELPEAWSERGVILESLQNLSEAVKSFSRALQLRPDHARAKERYEALAGKFGNEPEPSDAGPIEGEAAGTPETVEEAQEEEDLPEFDDLRPVEEPKPVPSTRPLRVRTFVEGLDDAIGGGVPWGHVVLVQGAPGTMKSSLGFSLLLNNAAKEGLHCLYISLEERASSLLKQMGSLGLKLHADRGSLVVLDPRTAKGILSERSDWIQGFQHALAQVKQERGLDLVVIDSLEALEVLAKFQDHRRELFRLFEWLRDLGVTSFLITERPDWVIGGHVLQGRWDEDFLADGVVHLRQHLVSDLEVQRRVRVVKMRGTKHDTGYLALVLDDGRFKATRAMSP